MDPHLHLAHPWWLLGWLLIPLVAWWLKHSHTEINLGQEARYADAHLLPHLLGQQNIKKDSSAFRWWALAWILMILAMAEPRYDVEYRSAYRPAAEIVILLDLSLSMDIQDVRPSRLARAKQEIQDLLRLNPGIRIGLIGFATVAHIVSPITEDMELLNRVLPVLSTELVYLKGSRLVNALQKAALLLSAHNQNSQHIILLSDGDFADAPAQLDAEIARIKQKGIQIHVLGIGTEGGGPVPYQNSFSRLNKSVLQRIAQQTGGQWTLAHYQDDDIQSILNHIMEQAGHIEQNIPAWVWKEYYPWLLIPVIALLAYLFGQRRIQTMK